MKNVDLKKLVINSWVFVLLIFGLPQMSFSQCEPDIINCLDTDEPGQMCPSVLPDGFLGEYYEQIITVLTPESGNVGELNITIHHLKLESIENLPEGITYNSETDEFVANEAYCLSLTGTPIVTGTYNLKITVIPYIRVLGLAVKWGEYVDSTSIVMNIGVSSYTNPLGNQDFALINAYPNPFSSSTRIGYTESDVEDVELRVYNMLGRQMHYEMMESEIGENYFDFSGQDLPPGYYIYSVIRKNRPIMGRMIKSR